MKIICFHTTRFCWSEAKYYIMLHHKDSPNCWWNPMKREAHNVFDGTFRKVNEKSERKEHNEINNTSLCLLLYFLSLHTQQHPLWCLFHHRSALLSLSMCTYQEPYTKPLSSSSSAAPACVKILSQDVPCSLITSIFQLPRCILPHNKNALTYSLME